MTLGRKDVMASQRLGKPFDAALVGRVSVRMMFERCRR